MLKPSTPLRLNASRVCALTITLGVHIAIAIYFSFPLLPISSSSCLGCENYRFPVEYIPLSNQDSPTSLAEIKIEGSQTQAQSGPHLKEPATVRFKASDTIAHQTRPKENLVSTNIEYHNDDDWFAGTGSSSAAPIAGGERNFERRILERKNSNFGEPPQRLALTLRDPPSPKLLIRKLSSAIGLWPPGYTDDPCPQIEKEISRFISNPSTVDRAQFDRNYELSQRYCR